MGLATKLRHITQKVVEENRKKTEKECLEIIPIIENTMEEIAALGKNRIYIDISPFDEDMTNNPLETGKIIFKRKDFSDADYAKEYLRKYLLEQGLDAQRTMNELYIRW